MKSLPSGLLGGASGPLLALETHERLIAARARGIGELEISLDLQRSRVTVQVEPEQWRWQGRAYPYLERCKDRTVYYWDGVQFLPVARYDTALVKLIPTTWGPPTFEIDGIKMLPTAQGSPYEDARSKVESIRPQGKTILDTCGGLGYFAACCVRAGARSVRSYEKNPNVVWLRRLNPWSPENDPAIEDRWTLIEGDITEHIATLPAGAFDAVLHDPPRFGIAGELYSAAFYRELARVLKPRGRLFHYTGTPNKLTTGRDVPREVAARLKQAGFDTRLSADGVLAVKA